MKKNLILLFLFINLNILSKENFQEKKYVINNTFTDLLIEPTERESFTKPIIFSKDDPKIESQLLYNEKLLLINEKDNWLNVRVLGQKWYTGKDWDYISGYIKKDQIIEVENFDEENFVVNKPEVLIFEKPEISSKFLKKVYIGTNFFGEKINNSWIKVKLADQSYGYIKIEDLLDISEIKNLNIKELRKNLVITAVLFLENPYRWGGRSFFDPDFYGTSTDCSGLVNLIYKANGLEIPRNSRDIFKLSKEINGQDLKSGDLIFFANTEKPEKINHVLLYLGEGLIIENTGNEPIFKTRIVRDTELFCNKKTNEIKSKDKIKTKYPKIEKERIIYFGTYFLN